MRGRNESQVTMLSNNQPAKLSYLANALMENRNGLLVAHLVAAAYNLLRISKLVPA